MKWTPQKLWGGATSLNNYGKRTSQVFGRLLDADSAQHWLHSSKRNKSYQLKITKCNQYHGKAIFFTILFQAK